MAAYLRVYDSRHLQADCQEPGSGPEPYARKSSMGYLYLYANNSLNHQLCISFRAAVTLLSYFAILLMRVK